MHELKTGPANVAGEAAVIRAADKLNLQAQPATLRATISITRAGTGKVETFDLIGTPAATDCRTDESGASPQGTPGTPSRDR